MNKVKMVLCALLAVVFIFPLAFAAAPAVRADSGEPPSPAVKADSVNPQEGAGAILVYDGAPSMVHTYYMKGKCVGYGWAGEKITVYQSGYLYILAQSGHNVEIDWDWVAGPGMAPIGLMPPSDNTTSPQMGPPDAPFPGANGYVGCIICDISKFPYKAKNKPRLSMSWASGTNGYENYYTGVMNAQVKVDSKSWAVKSIKGRILSYRLSAPTVGDGGYSTIQWEYKFTATPL